MSIVLWRPVQSVNSMGLGWVPSAHGPGAAHRLHTRSAATGICMYTKLLLRFVVLKFFISIKSFYLKFLTLFNMRWWRYPPTCVYLQYLHASTCSTYMRLPAVPTCVCLHSNTSHVITWKPANIFNNIFSQLFLEKWKKANFNFKKYPWIFRKRVKLKLCIE